MYFISSTGMNTSNDGGHIGLAKAIYYDHQFSVEKYLNIYVFSPDYAVKAGIVYSDRLPGTAFLMIPALAYSELLESFGLKTSNENNELDIVVASILPPLLGALSALMLFVFYYKVLKKDFNLSLFSTVVYALGTLAWLESSHLFSHAPSLFFVSLAVLVVVSDLKSISWKNQLVISSSLLGFASLIELQNFLFFIPILIYIIYKYQLNRSLLQTDVLKPIFLSVLIIGFFLTTLSSYNYLVFDEFTLKSNKFNPFFPEESSFISSLSGDFLDGLDRLYTSFGNLDSYIDLRKARLNDIPGVFVTSPVLVLSFIGYLFYYKMQKAKALLLLSCILISTLIAALHVTTLVRHIYTVNLFLFLPFVFFVDYVLHIKNRNKKILFFFILGTFILISVFRVLFSTVSYWGRNVDNLFLYSGELKVFLIANIPFVIVLFMILVIRKQILTRRLSIK